MPADDLSLAIRIRADTQQAADEMGKFNGRLDDAGGPRRESAAVAACRASVQVGRALSPSVEAPDGPLHPNMPPAPNRHAAAATPSLDWFWTGAPREAEANEQEAAQGCYC